MGKIEEKFKDLKEKGEKALIIYLTAGFPDFEKSIEIMEGMEKLGVDFLEIGVPFSDPIADGPIIQFSSYKALQNGINMKKVFKICRRLKKTLNIPYLIMSYYNPVYKFGIDKFIEECENSGVSGVIIPDLSFEESYEIKSRLKKRKIDFIELVFEDRRIIIRVSEDFFILVICEKKADFPLIKLTMNVINEEIKVDKDIKKLLRSLRGKKDLLAEAKGEAEWRELLEKMRLLA